METRLPDVDQEDRTRKVDQSSGYADWKKKKKVRGMPQDEEAQRHVANVIFADDNRQFEHDRQMAVLKRRGGLALIAAAAMCAVSAYYFNQSADHAETAAPRPNNNFPGITH